MFDQLKQLTLSELTQVFDRMTEEDVRPLLEAIKKAKRVFLVGAGREGLSTKSFAMRLTHLGKSSYWIWDDTTPGIGEGDLLICANGRADIDIVNIVVEKAKAAGATIAMVTARFCRCHHPGAGGGVSGQRGFCQIQTADGQSFRAEPVSSL